MKTGLMRAVWGTCSILLLVLAAGCESDPSAPSGDRNPRIRSFRAVPTSGAAPLPVQFSAFATDPEGSKVRYELDFGDHSPISLDPNVGHTYVAAGDYRAVLSVRDAEGSFSSSAITIMAGSVATVSFSGQVYPFFTANGCQASGCHVGPTPQGSLDLSGSVAQVYAQLVPARVDTAMPCNSLVLKKPSQRNCDGDPFPHTGGLFWPVGSPPYNTTQQWIDEGALNN